MFIKMNQHCDKVPTIHSISSIKKRMTEKAMQEMDELNIKCLQVLRTIVHNEERRMPEDWATRTTEPGVKKYY